MKYFKVIIGINIGVLLFYSILFALTAQGSHAFIGYFISTAVAIGIQVLVNIVLALGSYLKDEKSFAKAYLLSAGIVLVIGFSACTGIGNIKGW